jgi:hypothetical protein
MADAAALEACFASLPLSLVVFALLPLDQRMRCAEVCRAWRDALLERSLWLRLDMSFEAGLARPATGALLRAASARAGGQLQSLNVAECRNITHACLLAVVTANAGALRELRTWTADGILLPQFAAVAALVRAAPQLRVFDADVKCDSFADAQRLLRNEGAFAPLLLRKLQVSVDMQTLASALSLAEDLAAHSSLSDLVLLYAPLDTPAALDATVAAALALRLSGFELQDCCLSPASAPALARLLSGDALRRLIIINGSVQLLDASAAMVLGDALRANRTLR